MARLKLRVVILTYMGIGLLIGVWVNAPAIAAQSSWEQVVKLVSWALFWPAGLLYRVIVPGT